MMQFDVVVTGIRCWLSIQRGDWPGSLCERLLSHVRAVTADAVTTACDRFGTSVPPPVAALGVSTVDRSEATASFLEPGRTKVDILLADLRALSGWRPKTRLILEHLFPPPA